MTGLHFVQNAVAQAPPSPSSAPLTGSLSKPPLPKIIPKMVLSWQRAQVPDADDQDHTSVLPLGVRRP